MLRLGSWFEWLQKEMACRCLGPSAHWCSWHTLGDGLGELSTAVYCSETRRVGGWCLMAHEQMVRLRRLELCLLEKADVRLLLLLLEVPKSTIPVIPLCSLFPLIALIPVDDGAADPCTFQSRELNTK